MNYQGYKDLDCYKHAREIRMFISTLATKFPTSEKYLLTAQILDYSRSIQQTWQKVMDDLLIPTLEIFLL